MICGCCQQTTEAALTAVAVQLITANVHGTGLAERDKLIILVMTIIAGAGAGALLCTEETALQSDWSASVPQILLSNQLVQLDWVVAHCNAIACEVQINYPNPPEAPSNLASCDLVTATIYDHTSRDSVPLTYAPTDVQPWTRICVHLQCWPDLKLQPPGQLHQSWSQSDKTLAIYKHQSAAA